MKPTGYHKFYSDTRKAWVSASQLDGGERLRGVNGPLTVVDFHRIPGVERVYNMTVEGQHVYRVCVFGALVHNDCPPDDGGPPEDPGFELTPGSGSDSGSGMDGPPSDPGFNLSPYAGPGNEDITDLTGSQAINAPDLQGPYIAPPGGPWSQPIPPTPPAIYLPDPE
ncbi:MAG: hypothetical protein ACREHD_07115 [Pirellulales bacterium]